MNKDFKQGMESASKAYEDKFKNMAQEIEGTLKSVCKDMNNFKEIQDEIINITEEYDEKVNKHEKEILELRDIVKYNLHESLTVDMLDVTEKQVLAGIMLTLTKNMNLNDAQQFYCTALLKYIGLRTAPTNISFESIEEISDLNKQKIVLQTLMEVMFLHNNSFEFLADFNNITSYFSISSKGTIALQDNIASIYCTFGYNMIMARYYIPEANVTYDENLEIEEELFPLKVKTDYIIDKPIIIEEGQILKFRNKNINIKNTIYIKGGVLDIKYCSVNFNSDLPIIINLSNDGNLKLTNSSVNMNKVATSYSIESRNGRILVDTVSFNECTSLTEEQILNETFYEDTYFSFVKANDTSILVSNSNFEGCKNYMFAIEKNCKADFNACIINQHLGGFIYSENSQNSESIFSDLNIIKCKARRDYSSEYFLNGGTEKTVFRNCSIDAEGLQSSNIEFMNISIMGSSVLLDRCKMRNLTRRDDYDVDSQVAYGAAISIQSFSSKLSVEHCNFQNSGGIKVSGLGRTELSVENTTFTRCYGTLISALHLNINNCIFIDCSISRSYEFNKELSYSMLGLSDSVIFINSNEDDKHSNIKNCIFTRCNSKGGIIKIRCNKDSAKELSKATISNCKFIDCKYHYSNGLIDGTVDKMEKQKKETFTYYYVSNNSITGEIINIDKEMFKIAEKHLVNSKNESFVRTYIGPFAFDNKIEKAIQKIAPNIKQEDVLSLIDTSLFQNGAEGLIISKKGLHFSEVFSKPKFISYSSISSCYLERQLKPSSNMKFKLKSFVVISMINSSIYKPAIIAIVEEIQELINNPGCFN